MFTIGVLKKGGTIEIPLRSLMNKFNVDKCETEEFSRILVII